MHFLAFFEKCYNVTLLATSLLPMRQGFASLRGGDVVGEHDVIFSGFGERLILKHIATDRMIFSRGAIKAAIWGVDKDPGHYDMLDVLGLSK